MLDHMARRKPIRRVLLLVLMSTLLPLGMLAMAQGYGRLQRERMSAQAALHADARAAASIETAVRWRSSAALSLLASGLSSAGVTDCRRQVQWALENLKELRGIAITRGGQPFCSAGAAVPASDSADGFAIVGGAGRQLTFTVETGGVQLVALHDLIGMGEALRRRYGKEDTIAMVVDRAGGVAVSSVAPPKWVKVPMAAPGVMAHVDDSTGRHWRLSAAPLALRPDEPPQAWIVLAQHDLPLFNDADWFAPGYFILPLLSVALASLGVWVAANHSILRWIGALRFLARDMEHSRGPALAGRFVDAPQELRSLAASFLLLRRAMARRNSGLREALERQRALSLELHHRVGNNLQVIGSFLALTGQQANHDLRAVELRVTALAIVHKLHHQRRDLNTIRVDALITALAGSIERHALHDGEHMQLDIAPITIDIDPASALALWIVELVMPAPDGVALQPTGITLVVSDGEVLVTMNGVTPVCPSRIAFGLARQMGATMFPDTTRHDWQLRLPASNFSRPFVANAGGAMPG